MVKVCGVMFGWPVIVPFEMLSTQTVIKIIIFLLKASKGTKMEPFKWSQGVNYD